MDLSGKKIWQFAAGDTNRNFVRLCLEWDVMLNGPGHAGLLPDAADRLRTEKWSERKISQLTRFCREVAPGDIVVLRLGTKQVFGVGEVVGKTEWLDDFGDVDGWDLQLVRRVRWVWKAPVGEPREFAAYDLKWGDTIQELSDGPVRDWLEILEIHLVEQERELVQLPESCVDGESAHQVSVEEIAEYLFDLGVSAGFVDALADRMGDLQRIAGWYARHSDHPPSEHETVAYLVLPLLRTLGWTPQKMAVEWKRVDVALFRKIPRLDQNLCGLVEAKKLNQSCLTAIWQAKGYAEHEGRSNCQRIIVTDGIRYGIWLRASDGQFSESPSAYLNLRNLRAGYPIYHAAGAREALRLMAADWSPDQE